LKKNVIRLVQARFPSVSGGPIAKALQNNSGVIWIYLEFSNSQYPIVFRQSVLLHEARHLDGGTTYPWKHVFCPIPYSDEVGDPIIVQGVGLAGQLRCDDDERGAYGAQIEFLNNLAKFCTNCTEKIKADAAYYASAYLDSVMEPARQRLKKDIFEAKGAPLLPCKVLPKDSQKNPCGKLSGIKVGIEVSCLRTDGQSRKRLLRYESVGICKPQPH
jgi:hypothetical protein